MPDKHKRKLINYSIKKNLQIRLFIKTLGVALVGILIMATIFFIYSDREINNSFKLFHIHAENFTEYIFPAVVLSVAAAVFFAVGIALLLPLSIAGPIYRIEKVLKEDVAEGNLAATCNIRKGDDLGDLADTLNSTMEKLGSRIKPIRELATKLESTVNGMKNPDNNLKDLTQKINEGLSNFKL